MLCRAAVLLLAALSLAAGKPVRYDGYSVYHVVPASERDVNFLNEFARKHFNDIDFWRQAAVPNKAAHVMVSPETQSSFQRALEEKGMKYSVSIEDVQELIDSQHPAEESSGLVDWDDYHSLEDIYAWLDSLAKSQPGIVTKVVGGRSYEGLEILGVKISFGTGRPIVVIEGTIHAREWISPAFVTWFINQTLTSTDAAVRSIVEQFDFYIFPIINPDGYRFTRTDDRLWRKTRQPHPPGIGADANRNWDYRWAEEGASPFPSSETYAGPSVFSEVETKSLSDFIASLGSGLQVYLAFHSFGQMLIYPYGSPLDDADNADELLRMAEKAVTALKSRYGTSYSFGSIAQTIYPATGSSMDWVKSKRGTRFTFAWELRDQGEYGFVLPPEQIIPTCEETFDSVLSILEDVAAALRG